MVPSPDERASNEEHAASPCPEGMVYVDTDYCPRVSQRCLDSEDNKPNHITICHRFAPERTCHSDTRRQRYCIDRYEYPNKALAHPPVMVDAFDARAACESEGKRLCWASEWVAACEGPEKLPFPHGLSRDPSKCNIDNPWRGPVLEKLYSSDPKIAERELIRIDQSVPSGAKPACVSGFGVHDLTGNVDEWVMADVPRGNSDWAGLKGGAWGHVRNACRPITTSHAPTFTYYFVSFRCCKDAAPEPEDARGEPVWTPPPLPRDADPKGAPNPGWTPPKSP